MTEEGEGSRSLSEWVDALNEEFAGKTVRISDEMDGVAYGTCERFFLDTGKIVCDLDWITIGISDPTHHGITAVLDGVSPDR